MGPSEKNTAEFVTNSSLYKEFLAEREEILRHKWLESEKAGHDIGFEHALLDWIIKHRSAWREHRKEQLKAEEFRISNTGSQPPLLNPKFYPLRWLFKRGPYLQDFPRVAQGLKEKKPHGSLIATKGSREIRILKSRKKDPRIRR